MGSMAELSPAKVPKGSPELPARTQPRAVPTPSRALPAQLTQHKQGPAWGHPQSQITPQPGHPTLPVTAPSLLCRPQGQHPRPGEGRAIPIAPRRWVGASPASLGTAPEALSLSKRGRAPLREPQSQELLPGRILGVPSRTFPLAHSSGVQSSREGTQPGTPNPRAAMRTLTTTHTPFPHLFLPN